MKTAARILDGAQLAQKHLDSVTHQIGELKKKGRALTLGTVQVGEAKDTILYAKYLAKLLDKIGVELKPLIFPAGISETDLTREIMKLNVDAAVTGIMIYSPLPKAGQTTAVLDALDVRKDVEGRISFKSHYGVLSPTANSVMALLEASGCEFSGRKAVVVGHGDLVGKPVAVLLMDKLATVTVCNKETRELREKVEKADILVTAVGKPHVIPGEWVKPGAVVVDVGENFLDGKLVGDVGFEAAKDRAAAITPVPGGVGPLTNVMLVKNLLLLHALTERRNGHGSR